MWTSNVICFVKTTLYVRSEFAPKNIRLSGTFEKFGWDFAEPKKNSAAVRHMPKNLAWRRLRGQIAHDCANRVYIHTEQFDCKCMAGVVPACEQMVATVISYTLHLIACFSLLLPNIPEQSISHHSRHSTHCSQSLREFLYSSPQPLQ